MRSVYLGGGGALLALTLIGSPLMAAPTESVADLVCRFGGACPGDKPSAEAPAQARGANRGFSISRSGASTPSAATSRSAATVPARAPRAVKPQRMAGNAARAAVAAPVSRSDLRITFEKNSAVLTPDGEKIAAAFAEALKGGLTGRRYLIGGHTDQVGGVAYNRTLSQRRAQTVVDYLVAHGVEPSRLRAEGFGFARPLPDRAPASADNRRVEATPLIGVS